MFCELTHCFLFKLRANSNGIYEHCGHSIIDPLFTVLIALDKLTILY